MPRKAHRHRILLIGAGRFGAEHLKTWQQLEAEGLVAIAGIVVSSEEKQRELERQHPWPVSTQLTDALLRQVDAADIATPSETHYRLVRQCLPQVHVLVEKPLAMTRREAQRLASLARRSRHVLMVNHLYRFHPVAEMLRKLTKSKRGGPAQVTGVFLNPAQPGTERYSIPHEFLHYFDLLDDLFGKSPLSYFPEIHGRAQQVSLRYPGGMLAVLELGWKGDQKVRTLEIQYPDCKLQADFIDSTVTVLGRDRRELIVAGPDRRPLEASLRCFLQAIEGRKTSYPDAQVGVCTVSTAEMAMPGPRQHPPRTLVMGGGIFGASCAMELARHCEVVLAERHSELLTEASFLNQFRHHSGFHYPRSMETVREILATRADFDAVYNDAILRHCPSYYATAATAKEITAERYLAFCERNGLCFSVEAPPPGLLDLSRVSLAIRTDELTLDIPRLRELVRAKLAANPRIEVLLNTQVADGKLTRQGRKTMTLRNPRKKWQEQFDYLVNCTYANSNLLSGWFGFPLRRLRFDLCEMLVLEVPMPQVCITILDGPFMSVMSTGRDRIFLAYQIHDGLLKSVITEDGLPPRWGPPSSNHANMMRHLSEFFPVLKQARYIESRYGLRTVEAFNEDYDGRPTVVTRHGFGCWSVLGGKIATCVSNARQIARQIFGEQAAEADWEPDLGGREAVPAPLRG